MNYIKMSPLTGMVGYGGGGTGLTLHAGSSVLWYGDRGLVFGGTESASETNSIDYFDITNTSNATDFGNLYQGIQRTSGTASTSSGRAFQCGGRKSGGSGTKRLEAITISTTGNSSNWGNLVTNSARTATGSNGVRALVTNGLDIINNTALDSVEYFDPTSSTNGQDFGDLSQGKSGSAGCADATRAVIGGGMTTSVYLDDIDYFTIATTSNAYDWGNLTNSKGYIAACSNGIRGLWAGGTPSTKVIQYITFASTSDATTFGDLDVYEGNYGLCGLGNETRGVFAGGLDGNSDSTNIDYVTYQTTSNATDFGNLNASHADSPGGASGNAS